MALLSLQADYSEVRPRRPEGGPDGGRDIEATYRGLRAFGAVGFKNRATDSARDKREITEKFKSDLDRALQEDPGLPAFVFFTNVDLTPAERRALGDFGAGRGVAVVDIFHRERLRIILDNDPIGWVFRLKVFNIEMSTEEHVALLDAIASDVLRGVSAETTRLVEAVAASAQRQSLEFRRLDFEAARSRTVRRLDALVVRETTLDATDIGPFAMTLCVSVEPLRPDDRPILCMSATDAYVVDMAGESRSDPKVLYASEQKAWLPGSDYAYPTRTGLDRTAVTNTVRTSLTAVSTNRISRLAVVDDFHEAYYRLYVTPSLRSFFDGFMFAVNLYCVIALPSRHATAIDIDNNELQRVARAGRWRPELTAKFSSLGCVEIWAPESPGVPCGANGIHAGLRSNFDRFTPQKMPEDFVADTLFEY